MKRKIVKTSAPAPKSNVVAGDNYADQCAAYHMAGHAVVAYLLDRMVTRVSIVPVSMSGPAHRLIRFRPEFVKVLESRMDYDRPPAYTRELLILLAGHISDQFFREPGITPQPWLASAPQAGDEWSEAVSLTRNRPFTIMDTTEADEFLLRAHAHVVPMLRSNWKAVEALANRLLKRQTLGGATAFGIIAKLVDPGQSLPAADPLSSFLPKRSSSTRRTSKRSDTKR